MAMKTRKTYLIIELDTNKILHKTENENESKEEYNRRIKAKEKVVPQTMYQ